MRVASSLMVFAGSFAFILLGGTDPVTALFCSWIGMRVTGALAPATLV